MYVPDLGIWEKEIRLIEIKVKSIMLFIKNKLF
jgi:hypothetical protein